MTWISLIWTIRAIDEHLPDQFSCNLDHPARIRAGNLTEAARTDRRVRRSEMDLIETIEKLAAYLGSYAFSHGELPSHCEIGVDNRRTVKEIAAGISISAQLHLSERHKSRCIEELMHEIVTRRMTDPHIRVGQTLLQLRVFKRGLACTVQSNVGTQSE